MDNKTEAVVVVVHSINQCWCKGSRIPSASTKLYCLVTELQESIQQLSIIKLLSLL